VNPPVPKLSHKISTLIYAFNEQDELLMLHRQRPPNLGLWSPFGGKLHQDEGESPHQCAARETYEEIGLQFKPQDFHLTGIVAERAYEGNHHWLMFMFELKVRLIKLPPAHEEGPFEFIPLSKVAERPIPKTDLDVLWPLFLKHRGKFFATSIVCHSDGSLSWELDELLD
jgi:8-oxo-dGTP diphosphatase